MQAKRFIGSALVLAGLVSGCGGAGADMQEESTLESREDALPACGGRQYERIFYSEPEMINEVGWWYCECSSSSAYIYGRTTAYSAYTYNNYCFAG
jgi:hypothetical protein